VGEGNLVLWRLVKLSLQFSDNVYAPRVMRGASSSRSV